MSVLRMDTSEKVAETRPFCAHQFVEYVGFTQAFEFCKLCDIKKSDVKDVAKTMTATEISERWRTAWHAMADKHFIGSIKARYTIFDDVYGISPLTPAFSPELRKRVIGSFVDPEI